MNDILKSILLGVLTISIWIAASIEMNKEQNKTNDIELVVTTNQKNMIIFMETLTIDYEGDTKNKS